MSEWKQEKYGTNERSEDSNAKKKTSRFPSIDADRSRPSTSKRNEDKKRDKEDKDRTKEPQKITSNKEKTQTMTSVELEKKVKRNIKKVQEDRRLRIAGAARPRLRARSSYLDLLDQRKEFRQCLVDLLHKKDSNTPEGKAELDRRYHYFVNRGLSMATCPLQKPWITRIIGLVPKHLR